MPTEFRNEPLTDFSIEGNAAAMRAAIAKVKSELGREYPLVIAGERISTGDTLKSINPANRSEVVGSSAREARPRIIEASKSPTAELHLSLASLSSQSAEVTISVENIPPEAHAAELWLAVAERGLASNVLRGENEGRNLAHAAVLRSLTRVRAQNADAGSAKATNHVALDPSWKRENLRFVVFLQEPKTLHVFGAAAASIAH